MMARNSRMLFSSSTTRMRTSGISGGKCDGDGGSLAAEAADVDVTAVLLHDPMNQCQPDAAALGLRREEGLEDVRQVGGADAGTRVRDRDFQVADPTIRPNPQLAPVGHRLDRVEAEIPEHLPDLLGIRVDGQAPAVPADDLDVVWQRPVLEQQEHLVE